MPNIDDAYKRLLWLMKKEADSPVEPYAGGLYTDTAGVLTEYRSVHALLQAIPEVARYRSSDNGETPLFWAAFYGPLTLVERLVAMGADPHATLTDSLLVWYPSMESIYRGATPLFMAAAGGQPEIVQHLLSHGASARVVAKDSVHHEAGQTPIFVAARDLGTGETIRLLAQAGGDPNAAIYLGFTPLGKAAERGAGDVLAALLAAGADPSIPSGSKTVIEIAGNAQDPAAMRGLVAGGFGRVLGLSDVTRALDQNDIQYEVVSREDATRRGAASLRTLCVHGQVVDELHNDRPGEPDYYVWAARSDDDLQAIDLDDTLEHLDIGPRRFASDGEMKALLGIAEGGVTPFAMANDDRGRVQFMLGEIGSEGEVALEAFAHDRVVVLPATELTRAVEAFKASVGAPQRPPMRPPPLPTARTSVDPAFAASAPEASVPVEAKSASKEEADSEKLPRGCLIALVLLAVSVLGLARSCYLPSPDNEVYEFAPGTPWMLTVSTDLATVKGLCRFDDAQAAMHVDGEASPVPVPMVCENQDSWGHTIEVDVFKVKGVPVTTGREDITLVFRFELPDRPGWVGRKGQLKASGTLVYPFFDFDDAVVGSVVGTAKWEERRLPYEGEWDFQFTADNARYQAGVEQREFIDFLFVLAGILAIVFAFIGARHLPDAKKGAESPANS